MGFAMTSSTGKTAIGLACLGLIISVISLVVPYWLSFDMVFVKVHAGLWMACTSVLGQSSCHSVSDLSSEDNTTLMVERALMIMGIVFALLSIALSKWAVFGENRSLGMACANFCIAGSSCLLLTVLIFLRDIISAGLLSHIHIGAPLAVVAAILHVAAGILFMKSRPPHRAATIQPMGMV